MHRLLGRLKCKAIFLKPCHQVLAYVCSEVQANNLLVIRIKFKNSCLWDAEATNGRQEVASIHLGTLD
jgi:hypothetical protein